MKLTYQKITKENLEYAASIQSKIFPGESAYFHYKWTVEVDLEYEVYYLVYDQDKVIGITGLYSNEPLEETNSIWLGWFGVLTEYQKKGYGKKILEDTYSMAQKLAKKYPIRYFRLYTDKKENKKALPFYRKFMEIEEAYNNKQDINYENNCVIFSKSLTSEKVTYWNNRFLNLREITSTEK